MESLFRGLGLLLLGVSLTWLLTVVLGRAVTKRGFAFWVWDRSGAIGRLLVAVGFALAAIGLTQGSTSDATGTSMIFLGALMGMAGIWLILPGP